MSSESSDENSQDSYGNVDSDDSEERSTRSESTLSSSAPNKRVVASSDNAVDSYQTTELWIIRDARQFLAKPPVDSVWLYTNTTAKSPHTFRFEVAQRDFPGVQWHASLFPRGVASDSERVPCLVHWATFGGDVKHCWTYLTAELVVIKNAAADAEEPEAKKRRVDACLENGSAEDHCPAAEVEEFVGKITLGPNGLPSPQRPGVMCPAWPWEVLQSAMNSDGTLRIRLTLTIFSLERALRSHDLIRDLRKSSAYSDLTLSVGREHFPAHKCILAAASSEFKRLFDQENFGNALDLTQAATAAGLQAFLALAYFDICATQDDSVVIDVLKLAHRFKAEQVKDRVLPAVRTILSAENVLRVIDAAFDYDAPSVKEACFVFILENREKFQDCGGLSQLLRKSSRSEEVCRQFLRAFFDRSLACSRSCLCSGSFPREAPYEACRFPNDASKRTQVWRITNATKRLKQQSLICKFVDSVVDQMGKSVTIQWQLVLYPNGRLDAAQQNQGYVAFSLGLVGGPSFYGGPLPSCLAFVDVRLGSGPVGFEGKEPMEFTAKSEGLTVDRAWQSSTLSQEVKSNALEILVELRKVNVLQVLNCHDVVQGIRMDNANKAKLMPPKLSRSLRAVLEADKDSFHAVDTWLLSECRDKIAKSHSFSHAFATPHPSDPTIRFTFELKKESMPPPGAGSHNKIPYQLYHCASFAAGSRVKNFWSRVTAELLRAPAKEYLGGNADLEVIHSVTLGPSEFRVGQRNKASCLAWPLDVLQSAVQEDDTLQIRLTLTIYKIGRAIKSHELICSLRQSANTHDFALKVGGEQFPVHKCILAATSAELKARFIEEARCNEKVLDLGETTTAKGVKAFLSLAYFEPYDWRSDANIGQTICDVIRLASDFKANQMLQDQLLIVMKNVIDLVDVLQLLETTIATRALRAKELCFTYLLNKRKKLRKSDTLEKILERSEKGSEIRSEFLHSFFTQHMCCSLPVCSCAKPGNTTSQYCRRSDEKPFPDEHLELSYAWTIRDADVALSKSKVSFRVREDLAPRVRAVNARWSQRGRLKLKLYPKGRSLEAQQAGFASVSVGWSSDYFVQGRRDNYVWALVEATLNGDADSRLRMPFEFTFSTRALVFDADWPAVALPKAISGKNELTIQIKLTIVNISETLACHVMVQRVFYEQRAFADFSFKCGNESILVHKGLLAQRSDIFARMLASEMRETSENSLDLTEVTTPAGIKAFVSAIYFNEIDRDDGDVMLELLKLAHQFGLDDVKTLCDRKLLRHIDMENALEVLSACVLYGLPLSKAACVRYLGVNCVEFLKSPSWASHVAKGDVKVVALLAEEAVVQLGSLCKTTK